MTRPPPVSSLFPYTTLFRSRRPRPGGGAANRRGPRRVRARREALRRLDRGGPGRDGPAGRAPPRAGERREDRKSTRLNSSHLVISYAVFCLKKKKTRDKEKT